MPLTAKTDKAFHGFGILSMKVIVEKYGGTMSVEIVDKTFNLNMIFVK